MRIWVWDVGCRPVERGLVHGILGRVQALHILFMVSRCDVVVVGFRTPESFGHLNAARRLAISPEIDGRIVCADIHEKVCKVDVLWAREAQLPAEIELPTDQRMMGFRTGTDHAK